MAHIKLVIVSENALVALLAAHGAPQDARVVRGDISLAGNVSLVVESASFAWVPDGMPLERLPRLEMKQ